MVGVLGHLEKRREWCQKVGTKSLCRLARTCRAWPVPERSSKRCVAHTNPLETSRSPSAASARRPELLGRRVGPAPPLELPHRLRHQHVQPADRLTPPPPPASRSKPGPTRVVDEVVDRLSPTQRRRRQRCRRHPPGAVADRGRVSRAGPRTPAGVAMLPRSHRPAASPPPLAPAVWHRTVTLAPRLARATATARAAPPAPSMVLRTPLRFAMCGRVARGSRVRPCSTRPSRCGPHAPCFTAPTCRPRASTCRR